ncbi:MAG: signal peptidase II [Clostridia bacterium]|nr:signal peptidase II [Clostridia bacterium]
MFQLVSLISIAVLAGLDQFVKKTVSDYIAANGSKDFLFGIFRLTYVENSGAAFSSFSDSTVILSVLTSLIIVVCLVYLMMKKSPSVFVTVSLILVISGGIGNMIDRISNGFVIDFIEPLFVNFAVFNVADCFITVGAFMLAGYELVTGFKQKSVNSRGDKNA